MAETCSAAADAAPDWADVSSAEAPICWETSDSRPLELASVAALAPMARRAAAMGAVRKNLDARDYK